MHALLLASALVLALFTTPVANAADALYMTRVHSLNPQQPAMWARFCKKNLEECQPDNVGQVAYTAEAIAELERVNAEINRVKKPIGDYGPCVWYSIEKRRKLVRAGWPQGALLLTVVKAPGGAHMVLTVKTDQGEYILDNFLYRYKVVLWSKLTKYRFIYRQQGIRPGWTNLEDVRQLEIAIN